MKVRSASLVAVVAGFAAFSAPAFAAEECLGRETSTKLVVQVGQLKSNQGEVAVTVYPSDPRRFLAPRGKLARSRIKASPPMTEVCFYLPRPDTYAVAVYHDANANHDFDRNTVGLPAEGFGFSNDAPTRFGAPSFDSARFSAHAGDTTIRVKMRYGR